MQLKELNQNAGSNNLSQIHLKTVGLYEKAKRELSKLIYFLWYIQISDWQDMRLREDMRYWCLVLFISYLVTVNAEGEFCSLNYQLSWGDLSVTIT